MNHSIAFHVNGTIDAHLTKLYLTCPFHSYDFLTKISRWRCPCWCDLKFNKLINFSPPWIQLSPEFSFLLEEISRNFHTHLTLIHFHFEKFPKDSQTLVANVRENCGRFRLLFVAIYKPTSSAHSNQFQTKSQTVQSSKLTAKEKVSKVKKKFKSGKSEKNWN